MSDQPEDGAGEWRDRQPLTGTDLNDFLSLRRVCGHPDFRVVQAGDEFLLDGRPLLPFLADGVRELMEVGHVTLGETNTAASDTRPVIVTASGRARYEQLCDKQGIPPYPAYAMDGGSTS